MAFILYHDLKGYVERRLRGVSVSLASLVGAIGAALLGVAVIGGLRGNSFK